MFLFGQIDMQIKLVPGRSAGTVVAYYVRNQYHFNSVMLSPSLSIWVAHIRITIAKCQIASKKVKIYDQFRLIDAADI